MDEGAAQPESYGNLVDRAYLSLREAGGNLTEGALVARMFGSRSEGPLWLRLLSRVLESDPRFARLPDGRWTIHRPSPESPPLDRIELVAVDLKATGPKPWTDRLLDVAAVRLFADGRSEVFSAGLNPQRRIPKYVTSATGIRAEDAAESPTFDAVADDLTSFLGSSLLVGHGLAVQMAFLQYELRMAGKPALSSEMLDTLDLAALLLPDLGKPSLANVAGELGLGALPPRHAMADAGLVGQMTRKLLEMAATRGYATLDDLRSALHGLGSRSAFTDASEATRPRLLLDSGPSQDVPSSPGVYVLKDAGGRPLYVGKAANLRERLAAYQNRPLGYVRQMEGLIDSVVGVEAMPVDTELEAILLEARLIRLHRPPFNVQRRSHLAPVFLRIGRAEPFPRLQPSGTVKADDALYFGPFRSGAHLRRTLDLLLSLIPLRTCTRSLGKPRKGRQSRPPCTRLGSGACAGPCVGTVSAEEYGELVERAIRMLRGEKDREMGELRRRLREAVGERDGQAERAVREAVRRLSYFRVEAQLAGLGDVPHPSPLPEGEGAGGGDARRGDYGVVLMLQPTVDRGAVVVSAMGPGVFLGAQRLEQPVDAGDLAAFVERALTSGEATSERVEEFNLAIRWLIRHEEEVVVARIQVPSGRTSLVGDAAALVERVRERWGPAEIDVPWW